MSRSSSETRVYFDAVQDYFLERTGRGLVLSSRDLELLIGWRREGASAATICQGIDEAVESLDGAPRDLHACKRFVEPRIESTGIIRSPSARATHEPAAPGASVVPDTEDAEASEWLDAFARLERAYGETSRPELREAYAQARTRLMEAQKGSVDTYSTFCDVDDWLVETVFDALSIDERRPIELEIEGKYGAHFALMTEEARAKTRLASLREILCKRLGLLQLTF